MNKLRRGKFKEYEYLGVVADRPGWCRIMRGDGAVATVKAAWLEFRAGEGDTVICTPGSFRKSIHVEGSTWE